MQVDLHTHTNHSDGMVSVDGLMALAVSKGIKTIAITDHDTVRHLSYARKRAAHYGLCFVPGVELSCYNFAVMKKTHLVALGVSGEMPQIEQLCRQVSEGRNCYHEKLISNIRDMGYDISFEKARSHSMIGNVFKIHLYMAIKEKYPEIGMGFYKKHFLMTAGNSSDLEMGYIDIKTGIETVLGCGAIPILAHPNLYGSLPELEEYISYGLAGIEISHPSFDEEDGEQVTGRIKELAVKHQLLLSGGSDFHLYGAECTLGQYGLSEEEFVPLRDRLGFGSACTMR